MLTYKFCTYSLALFYGNHKIWTKNLKNKIKNINILGINLSNLRGLKIHSENRCSRRQLVKTFKTLLLWIGKKTVTKSTVYMS